MILETLIKSSILPGLFLALGALSSQAFNEQKKMRIQSLIAFFCFLIGTYFLKGLPTFPPTGGLDGFQWLALIFLFYSYWESKLFLSLAAFAYLAWPLYEGYGIAQNWIQNAIAFWLLAFSIWSFSERQITRGLGIPTLVSAMVVSSAAALFSLFYSSALISQVFGIFAALNGFLIGYSLIFKPRFSAQMASGFLIAFPLVLIGGLHLYLDINPYKAMALALPYAVLILRTYWSPHVSRPLVDAILTGIFASLSVSWLIYGAYLRG